MSFNRHLQEKIYRLETLRKYQVYYGPNTPFQIITEINQLEVELRRMLKADVTRRAQKVDLTSSPNQQLAFLASQNHKTKATKAPLKRVVAKKPKKVVPKKALKKPKTITKKKPKTSIFGLSQATIDLVATISFIGLVFLLGTIVFAAYRQTQLSQQEQQLVAQEAAGPQLRPTFTSTPSNPVEASNAVAVASAGEVVLPAAVKQATDLATPVPTLTPSEPTATPTPFPTDTPEPTHTPLPAPPQPTAIPNPPTPIPGPQFPFTVLEQGNRMFQKTTYHGVTVYVAITTEGNVPIGGLKIVGDHTSGIHAESSSSDWRWSAVNCLDCDYAKFGNVKFEPGPITDGVWNIYVADGQGTPLSPTVPLSYSSDPNQWVWDFVLFRKNPGM